MGNVPPRMIDALEVQETVGSRYPSPFNEPCAKRSNRALGDFFGLKDFGVNLLILEPGAWSSQRHWHSHEDELVYVLEGTPTLITDEGDTDLRPGCATGFRAGVADGHHIVNMGETPAKLIVVGSRKVEDDAFYSDIDMQILRRADGGGFTRKDGEPYLKHERR
jgi:uncharacterized cupin superfamily protein